MQKTYLTLSLFVAAGFLLMSNNLGVATVQNLDRTGSPVSAANLCNQCHSGGAVVPTIDTRVLDSTGNEVSTYDAGQTYTYEVELSATGAAAYGFQTVALLSSNANAGNLVAHTSNTKMKTLSGRKYGEHNGKSVSGLFVMTWTAPAAGSGNVSFYASGIACNSNNSTSGDRFIKANALVLTENSVSGINAEETGKISLYPNPASGNYLNINMPYNGEGRVVITDMAGKIIRVNQLNFINGQNAQLDIQNLAPGAYGLIVINSNGNQQFSSKFIRQ